MKKQIILFDFMFLPMMASAYDAKIDGIYYNFSGNEATVTYDDNFTNYRYTGTVIIPESLNHNGNTYSVTSIGENAFDGCSDLTSVAIGKSVTSIGGGAFYGCSSISSVTIPCNVTFIGTHAFYGCI